jgi:hypothetical protein
MRTNNVYPSNKRLRRYQLRGQNSNTNKSKDNKKDSVKIGKTRKANNNNKIYNEDKDKYKTK